VNNIGGFFSVKEVFIVKTKIWNIPIATFLKLDVARKLPRLKEQGV
jgi:hypothetical protein